MNLIIEIAITIVCGIITMLVHEVPKSIVAFSVTHPIYRSTQKINKNVLKYIDPLGLIMFVLLNVGWQKPYEYNSSKFRDKNKGILAIALTGIFANLLIMSALLPMFNYITLPIGQIFVGRLIYFNFSIVIMNLLPIPPLEMSKIIHSFSNNAYFKLVQNERIIHTIFILLLVIGILSRFVDGIFRLIILPFIN
ncbi:MAG: hypothetical protein CVU84_03260 [Firmicutes bacterium HGW-Firmicutes-1]|jgi:Zn-dependent protease|nr:MAG: hypothetical protein CVU84_03260 [Firmicutes bacterium HGW-Firmicutes-1]